MARRPDVGVFLRLVTFNLAAFFCFKRSIKQLIADVLFYKGLYF